MPYSLLGPYRSPATGPMDLSAFVSPPETEAALMGLAGHSEPPLLPVRVSPTGLPLAESSQVPETTSGPGQFPPENPRLDSPQPSRDLGKHVLVFTCARPPELDEEQSTEEDFEIDPVEDPLQASAPQSIAEWEESVRNIRPCEPIVEDPALQRQKVFDLLERIRNVDLRSDLASQSEAEAILTSLPDTLRNPEQFVAGSFLSCYPAWAALLEKSKRRSAKTVLGWLRNGVNPSL